MNPNPMLAVRQVDQVVSSRQPKSYKTVAASSAVGLAGGLATIFTALPATSIYEKLLVTTGTTMAGYGAGKIIKQMRKQKDTVEQRPEFVAVQNPGELNSIEIVPIIGSLKKGGTVKKTGLYRLHKGEKVIPKK